MSAPAVADDGTIYFGSRDRKFYAVTPRGKLKWFFPTGAWVDSSPAIAADGTIYFGSWDTNFYALNQDGSKKWEFATAGIVDSSPAVAADGTIYFGSHDKKFYALKPDGTVRWTFATGGPIISSPAINSDGTVYFTSTDGNLYALLPDGKELWRSHTGGVTRLIAGDWTATGNIYLAASQRNLSVGSDGKMRWDWTDPHLIDSTPAVAANGLIYFSAPWNQLFAFQKNGAVKWQVGFAGPIVASPAIGADGTIYVSDHMIFICRQFDEQPRAARKKFVADVPRKPASHRSRANVN